MDLTQFGRDILERQSFSRLLGTRLERFDRDGVELRLTVRDDMHQQHGFPHGGVVAYLADNALTFAGALAFDGLPVVTVEIKVNYLRPAIGTELIARGSLLSGGRTQSVSRCEIFVVGEDGREKLCAAGQGTTALLPQKRTPETN